MNIREIADRATYESALLSGSRLDGEKFIAHRSVMRDVFQCQTGALTHPIIINMTLCTDRSVRWRESMRAGDTSMVRPRHVKWLFEVWWRGVQHDIERRAFETTESLEEYCWKQHDHFLSLSVFDDQNGRTARVIYYMLRKVLKLPFNEESIISSSKARTYNAHKRQYREEVFAPRMRSYGYIPD